MVVTKRPCAAQSGCILAGGDPEGSNVSPAGDLGASAPLAYGREIFARVDRQGPPAFTPAWVDELLMDWTMSDEPLKVQLFRFVDVLPR